MGPKHFNAINAKNALLDILKAFSLPENQLRMDKARESAGNDMLKSMQIVFPVATQVQQQVISKYGFTEDGDGLVQFTQMVRMFEKQDPEILKLSSDLRSIVMPPMMAPLPPASAAVAET